MKGLVLVLIRSKVRGVHWTLDTGHWTQDTGHCPVSVLVRHVAEQVGDRLSIVGSSHRLGKHHAYLEYRMIFWDNDKIKSANIMLIWKIDDYFI